MLAGDKPCNVLVRHSPMAKQTEASAGFPCQLLAHPRSSAFTRAAVTTDTALHEAIAVCGQVNELSLTRRTAYCRLAEAWFSRRQGLMDHISTAMRCAGQPGGACLTPPLGLLVPISNRSQKTFGSGPPGPAALWCPAHAYCGRLRKAFRVHCQWLASLSWSTLPPPPAVS